MPISSSILGSRDETRPYEVRRHSRARLKCRFYPDIVGMESGPRTTQHGNVRIAVVAGFIPASVGLCGLIEGHTYVPTIVVWHDPWAGTRPAPTR